MTMQQAIEKNRQRTARYQKAERQLRAIRLNIFEYEDAGKAEKAERIILKLKDRLKPFWEARNHAVEAERTQNYMM